MTLSMVSVSCFCLDDKEQCLTVSFFPDRYNPSNLPYMEEYLSTQIKEGQYDLLANLAILKLSAKVLGNVPKDRS